jgi:hypothetical protein
MVEGNELEEDDEEIVQAVIVIDEADETLPPLPTEAGKVEAPSPPVEAVPEVEAEAAPAAMDVAPPPTEGKAKAAFEAAQKRLDDGALDETDLAPSAAAVLAAAEAASEDAVAPAVSLEDATAAVMTEWAASQADAEAEAAAAAEAAAEVRKDNKAP